MEAGGRLVIGATGGLRLRRAVARGLGQKSIESDPNDLDFLLTRRIFVDISRLACSASGSLRDEHLGAKFRRL